MGTYTPYTQQISDLAVPNNEEPVNGIVDGDTMQMSLHYLLILQSMGKVSRYMSRRLAKTFSYSRRNR